ncbi:MAG: hypothetical protein ACPGSD_01160 [Flavobacteriales bacterium]
MKRKELTIAVQDYKEHGYFDTIGTDKGMILELEDDIFDRASIKVATCFIKEFGEDFGKKEMTIPANSYGQVLEHYKYELENILKTQRTKKWPITDRRHRSDVYVMMLGKQYVVNRRDDDDGFLEFYHGFYCNLKEYNDKGHPLYIQFVTEEDIKKYPGNHKCGDYFEPLKDLNAQNK